MSTAIGHSKMKPNRIRLYELDWVELRTIAERLLTSVRSYLSWYDGGDTLNRMAGSHLLECATQWEALKAAIKRAGFMGSVISCQGSPEAIILWRSFRTLVEMEGPDLTALFAKQFADALGEVVARMHKHALEISRPDPNDPPEPRSVVEVRINDSPVASPTAASVAEPVLPELAPTKQARKGKNINAKIQALLDKDPTQAIWLTAEQFAGKFGCVKSTVIGCRAWKTIIAARKLMQVDRLQKKRKL